MPKSIRAIIFALVAVSAGGSACAMKPLSNPQVSCSLVGEDQLPATLGGSAAVCRTIEQAVAAALAGRGAEHRWTIAVRVTSPHSAGAIATGPDGRSLPEQKVAVSDSDLNPRSVDMLARALAGQIATGNPASGT